jgi:hypothetical protein
VERTVSEAQSIRPPPLLEYGFSSESGWPFISYIRLGSLSFCHRTRTPVLFIGISVRTSFGAFIGDPLIIDFHRVIALVKTIGPKFAFRTRPSYQAVDDSRLFAAVVVDFEHVLVRLKAAMIGFDLMVLLAIEVAVIDVDAHTGLRGIVLARLLPIFEMLCES